VALAPRNLRHDGAQSPTAGGGAWRKFSSATRAAIGTGQIGSGSSSRGSATSLASMSGKFGRRQHPCLDGGASPKGRSCPLRHQQALSDEGLFELGASGRRVGGSEQKAGFRLAGFHRGVPDANAVGAVQTVRPVRTARGGRTGAAFRIFDAGKEANVSVVSGRENFCSRENPDDSLSRRSVRPLEYSDRCSSPLPRPRRRAHCDRRRADALRGPGRDHGAARPARRR
jgi:hypothetical protein